MVLTSRILKQRALGLLGLFSRGHSYVSPPRNLRVDSESDQKASHGDLDPQRNESSERATWLSSGYVSSLVLLLSL